MEQHLVDIYLHRAIEELHTSALSTQLIRRLAIEEGAAFTNSALRFLEKGGESGGHRYLSAMLLRQPDIFDQLTDPSKGSKKRSVALFRRLLTVDPSLDVKLARKLPDRNNSNGTEAYAGMKAARLLDVLDETSRGRRLVPILGHLVNSRDPRTCARATLFVGRRIQNPLWTARQLQRPDERVQANAVESLWGVKTDEAIQLLRRCVDDHGNRVAGNSLVGLHAAGEPGILERIAEMAIHRKAKFRATTAWAMGRVGDPLFGPLLNLLVKDPNPMVRGAALRALIAMKKSEDRPIEEIREQAIEISLSPQLTEEEILAAEIPPAAFVPNFELKPDGASFSAAR